MSANAPVRLLAVEDEIFEVRLSIPERRNPLTVELLDQIAELLSEAEQRGARALLVSGEGKSFCAGADLHAVHNTSLGDQNQVGLGASLTWEKLEWFRAPTIAVVQGHAIAGGFNLALCCDLVVAENQAIFQDTHARWGLVPGSGEVQRLVRRFGLSLARDLLYSCRPLTATEGYARGFVSRLAAPDLLRETALELARSIRANNARALAYIKAMVNVGFDRTVAEARWYERLITGNGQVNTEPDPDREARLADFREGRARGNPAE